jgi:hypothetical protein
MWLFTVDRRMVIDVSAGRWCGRAFDLRSENDLRFEKRAIDT